MININKVTTKQGDKGQTLGPGCKKINKNSNEIEFIGSLDEINAFLGEVHYNLTEENELLTKIQNDIFNIGACFYKKTDINENAINFLEENIKTRNENFPPLTSFLLPQGNIQTIKLHIARVTTRKTERNFYKITENIINYPNMAIYLNRLSDLLFVLLRKYEKKEWQKNN